MATLEVVRALASIVTAVGVLLAVCSLYLASRQQKRQFESFYIQRYWTLMDQLSLEVIRGSTPGSGLCSDDEKIVRAYFRLCEDELELRAGGWISARTWDVWGKGIFGQLRRQPFAQMWATIDADSTAQGQPDFTYLREFLRTGDDPQPLWHKRRRKWLASARHTPALRGEPDREGIS